MTAPSVSWGALLPARVATRDLFDGHTSDCDLLVIWSLLQMNYAASPNSNDNLQQI